MLEIRIENYSKSYHGKKVLDLKSMRISSGVLTLFAGENGSGKSTLAKSIASLVLPDEGKITLLREGRELRRFHSLVYYIFESGRGFYPYLTARQNLQYFLRISGIKLKKGDPEVHRLSELFSFTPFLETKVNQLSQGNRQKLALLLALRSGREILIFDEPTNGLDSPSTDLFISQIMELAQRRIILLTTHEEKLLNRPGNRVFRFKEGQVTLG